MKDNTLLFEVKGQYIVRLDSIEPVAKCRNLYKAQFQFKTDEWTGTKTALFVQGEYSKSVILDENGVCEIPWEFFDSDNTTFGYVSVYCGDLVTANRVVVDIVKSGYQESDASVPPSPDVYQQLMKLAEDTKEIAQSVRDDADNCVFDGEEGYSPKVSLTEELDGVTVTVQNKDVQQSAKVKNGKDGKPGKNGDPGADGITPHIGENGNWHIGDTDTGKPSRGLRGENATDKQVRTAVDAYMEENPVAITVDPTLAQEGQAADAKATGDKILQFTIKNTASGESIVLTDGAEEKLLDFGMQGKTEQLTTEGKNLFDIDEFLKLPLEQFSNYGNARVLIITLKPNTAYTMHTDNTGSLTGEVDVSRSLYFTSVDDMMLDGNTTGVFKGHNITKTSDETGKLKIVLIDRKNAIPIVNKEKYVMLAEGSTALPYEPYTGGKPSPSVEYPQEIVSAGKYDEVSGKYVIDVSVTGKNLINVDELRNENGKIDSVFTKARDISNFDVIKDRKYLLISKGTMLIDVSYSAIYFGKDDLKYLTNHNDILSTGTGYKLFTGKEMRIVLTAKETCTITKVIIHGNAEKTDAYIAEELGLFEISDNDINIDYETYRKPQTIQLQLDEPLRGIGEYKDDITKDGIVRKIGHLEIKGGLIWNDWGKQFRIIVSVEKAAILYSKYLCNYTNDVKNFGNQHFIYLYFTKEQVEAIGINTNDTLEVANKKLNEIVANKPIVIEYPLKTPIFVPFDEETQIALNALHTNYPTTVITNSEDCEMEVTYVCDTKTYIDNKFKELQQATISTNLEMLERRYEVIL